MKVLHWLLARLKEPSTYAGVAGLALAFGVTDTQWMAISSAVAGLASVAAAFLGENPKA